jgi:ABC-type microcin C transport system duplicated ATPase subunit YejF
MIFQELMTSLIPKYLVANKERNAATAQILLKYARVENRLFIKSSGLANPEEPTRNFPMNSGWTEQHNDSDGYQLQTLLLIADEPNYALDVKVHTIIELLQKIYKRRLDGDLSITRSAPVSIADHTVMHKGRIQSRVLVNKAFAHQLPPILKALLEAAHPAQKRKFVGLYFPRILYQDNTREYKTKKQIKKCWRALKK